MTFCENGSRRLGLLAFIAFAIMRASPALAASCSLNMIADLPVTLTGLRASVPVKVNGQDSRFWLDSGAFFNTMSKAKADEFGLTLHSLPVGFEVVGVGGSASAELGSAKSFDLAGHAFKGMEFVVAGSDSGALIGRNILGIADTEFDLAHGSVKLLYTRGCTNIALAYWAPGKPYFVADLNHGSDPRDHDFLLTVHINGVALRAEIDSGAPHSIISRNAATRAGIDLDGPGVTPLHDMGGLGQHLTGGWSVPVDRVDIGNEGILKTRLDVIDNATLAGIDSPDMLLGLDFLLAHHLYVARDQRLIFFTYGGGKPFLSGGSETLEHPAPSPAVKAALPANVRRVEALEESSAEPTSADDYARRGNFRMTRHDGAGALADFSRAIALASDHAGYYRDRAKAYAANDQMPEALADIDKALSIEPGNAELLRTRAFIRLGEKDRSGALADAQAAMAGTPTGSLKAAELADLFVRLGQPARAIPLYGDVIAAHRDDSGLADFYNGRCWARALANVDLDDALEDCNQALKRAKDDADILDSRGLVHFRQKDYALAVADYDAALKIEPKIAWSLHMRGLAREKLGHAGAGKADLAAARAVDPDIDERAAGYGLVP